MEITWYGHATFSIAYNDTTLFIDPFFEGNPAAPTTWDAIEKCDLILVTHDHGDHIGQTLELAEKHKAPVVTIFDSIGNLVGKGLPEELGIGMNIGGTVTQNDIRIKMVQAAHSAVTGVPTGFILTFPDGTCVYNSGDTGLFGDMELFGKFHDIDIAILPIGGHFTMDAEQAAYACKLLGCKTVIPQHWGTWPLLEQNTTPMAEALKKHSPETKLVPIEIGKPTTF